MKVVTCIFLLVQLFASVLSFQPARLSLGVTQRLTPTVSNRSPVPQIIPVPITQIKLSDTGVSSPDDDDEPKEEDSESKVQGRKKRVKIGYQIVALGYIFFSALVFQNGLQQISPLTLYAVSGPLLVAGVNYALIGAAKHDRLSSDTYKRLNLSVGLYGVCACVLAYCAPKFRNVMWLVPSVVLSINSVKGYGYGLKGWMLEPASPIKDILGGLKSNAKTMLSKPKNVNSGGYLVATLFAGALKLAKIAETFQLLVTSNAPKAIVGTRIISLAKLSLLTAVTFTLKDAADRDRLQGSTFILLNFLAAFVYGAMAAHTATAGNVALGAVAAACSVLSTTVGLTSFVAKKKQKSTS